MERCTSVQALGEIKLEAERRLCVCVQNGGGIVHVGVNFEAYPLALWADEAVVQQAGIVNSAWRKMRLRAPPSLCNK